MVMPSRAWTVASGSEYRFGFNGKENDDEVKGDDNSLDFGARIYDSRLGKWLSTDVLFKKHPDFTPYAFALNNPIYLLDVDGQDVDDSKLIKKGDYHKGYKRFARTSQGRKFISEFSNGHDTGIFGMGPHSGGSFSKNTLKFTNDAVFSGGSKVTLNNGSNSIDLQKVTAEDIKSIGLKNLTFTFNIQLNPYTVKSETDQSTAEAAQVLGHESFIHLEYYLTEMKKLQGEIDAGAITEKQVAERLRSIDAAGGLQGGEIDHKNWILGKKQSYDKYIDEVLLDSNSSEGEKGYVRQYYNEEVDQYSIQFNKQVKVKKK